MPDQIAVVASAVETAITVAAILLAIRFVLLPTLIETFRMRLFRMRRELFLHRVDGDVSAEDEAYRLVMRQINGMIRFAESFSFARLFLFRLFAAPKKAEANTQDLAVALAASPSRELLDRYVEDLGFEAVRHMVISSPLAWGFLVLLIPLALVLGAKAWLGRQAHKLGRRPSIVQLRADAATLFDDTAGAAVA